MFRVKRAAVLVVMLLLLLTAAGCGSDGQSATTSSTTAARVCARTNEAARLTAAQDPTITADTQEARLEEIKSELTRTGPKAVRDFHASLTTVDQLPEDQAQTARQDAVVEKPGAVVLDGLRQELREADGGAESTTSTTIPPTTTTTVPTSGSLLWFADADADTDADSDTGDRTGNWRKEVTSSDWTRLAIVDDPLGLYGKVYRANLTAADIRAGYNRAEWRGSYVNGTKATFGAALPQELFYGWRSMFGGTVKLTGADNDGNWMQLKGDSTYGGPAVGLTIRQNRLALRTIDGAHQAWLGPLMTSLMDGRWHDFVLRVNYSETDTGYLELTLNGQPQTMLNGQTRIYLPTVCPLDTNVFWKMGAYSMTGGAPTHWVESPRIGTSAAAVTP